ncbi:MAG: type II secretion system protein [Patescibacteria group bacterium]
MNKSGFTLLELMISIVVILILAAAVLGGTGSVMQNLRFGNAFNKIVFMVQSVRSMALIAKGDIAVYGIAFTQPNVDGFGAVETFSQSADDQKTVLESFILPSNINSYFYAAKSANVDISCGNSAGVTFERGTVRVTFDCGGQSPTEPVVVFGLKEKVGTRSKSFRVHKQTGMPQMP